MKSLSYLLSLENEKVDNYNKLEKEIKTFTDSYSDICESDMMTCKKAIKKLHCNIDKINCISNDIKAIHKDILIQLRNYNLKKFEIDEHNYYIKSTDVINKILNDI